MLLDAAEEARARRRGAPEDGIVRASDVAKALELATGVPAPQGVCVYLATQFGLLRRVKRGLWRRV